MAAAVSHAELAHQSRGRQLTDLEQNLAIALERIFATGEHDFDGVARELQEQGVPRPSGAGDPWTAASLETELQTINASLDAAYAEHGFGP